MDLSSLIHAGMFEPQELRGSTLFKAAPFQQNYSSDHFWRKLFKWA